MNRTFSILKNKKAEISVFTSAVFLITTQVSLLPILNIFFGDSKKNLIFLLAIIFCSIAIGNSGKLNLKLNKVAQFFSVIFFIFSGLLIYANPVFFVENNTAKGLLIFSIFISQIYGGDLISRSIYSKRDFDSAYSRVHLYALILILIYFIFSIPTHFLFFISGLILLINGVAQGNDLPKPQQLYRINLKVESILCGLISSAYLSLFLEMFYTTFYPTGFEQIEYLFLTFLFLFLSPFLAKKTTEIFPKLDPYKIISSGVILFLILIILIISHSPLTNHFNPRALYYFFSKIAPSYLIYSFIFFLIFFLPYIFFSITLPFLQKKSSETNQIFNFSLGNLFGLIVFGIILQDQTLYLKVTGILFSLAILKLCDVKKRAITRTFKAFFPLVFLFFIPKNLEEKCIEYGQLLRNISRDGNFFDEDAIYPKNFPKQVVSSILHKNGDIGFILQIGDPPFYHLGLGAYTAIIQNSDDSNRSKLFKKFDLSKESKILLVGLGNHIHLRELHRLFSNVDVVDIFKPFGDINFRNTVGEINNFRWPAAGVTFYNEDILQFLAQKHKDDYDFIVINLTSAHFPPSQKANTIEFVSLLKRALKKGGLVINASNFKKIFDCVFVNQFNYAFHADQSQEENLILLTDSLMRAELIKKNKPIEISKLLCNDTPALTIKNQPDLIKSAFNYSEKDFYPTTEK